MGQAKRILEAVAAAIEREAAGLSELDAIGGDGDHGMSLTLGARGALAAVEPLGDIDVGAFLDAVGRSLISGIGAAMGPLYGTALVRAGAAVAGKRVLSGADVAEMLAAARDGMIARGKAKAGDKTMLDALIPAAAAGAAAAGAAAGPLDVLRAASLAADAGAAGTSAMIATKGRAARLGERTRGHQDAGATSTAVILRAVYEAAAREHAPA